MSRDIVLPTDVPHQDKQYIPQFGAGFHKPFERHDHTEDQGHSKHGDFHGSHSEKHSVDKDDERLLFDPSCLD